MKELLIIFYYVFQLGYNDTVIVLIIISIIIIRIECFVKEKVKESGDFSRFLLEQSPITGFLEEYTFKTYKRKCARYCFSKNFT